MKKIILYSITILSITIFFSCKRDFLDKKESNILTSEQVFGDPVLFQQFHDDIYSYLHYWPGDWACQSFGGLGRIAYSSFEGASDLAEASRSVAGTNASFNLGNWSQLAFGARVELIWPWEGAYAGIRRCNVVMEKADGVPGLSIEKINKCKSEALFLRAFFYFELIKRYGGVPYITKSLNENDDMNFARDPYDTCVAKIVKDIDASMENLPIGSGQANVDFGRPTKGAALALKAKVLLYAASPLNTEPYNISSGSGNSDLFLIEQPNTESEKHQMWIEAAKAAYAVIQYSEDNGQYSLADSAHYLDIFYGDAKNSEVIYSRVDGLFSFNGSKAFTGWISFADCGASKGYGGSAGTYPTQNMVDMYEMADGSIPITGHNDDGSPIINASTSYDEQHMWENRDPRLKLTVLCNQDMWQDRPVEIWFDKNNLTISGTEMKDAQDYTTTGYLCRKMWPEKLRQGSTASVNMNWIWFRYSDVILWYAEAMNQAYGPDADGLGNGRNARWALNLIRNRMNPSFPYMRDVKASTKEQFMERLLNERAVEFVYEEQRWWDIIRNKKGVETFGVPIYGARIYRTSKDPLTFEITRRKLETRVFEDYMHKYPIPYSQMEKCSNLKQNPGW
jgi:starch-binding outer membrane protein, SusD/RagB family